MSSRDAARILTKSPWTHVAEPAVVRDRRAIGWTDSRSDAPYVPSGRIPSAEANLLVDSLDVLDVQQWNPPKLTIRWESSVEVKKALNASGFTTFARPGYYVVSVAPPSRGARPFYNASAIADQIQHHADASVSLTVDGHRKIDAANVTVDQRGGQPLLLIFFPRTEAIGTSDEVSFELNWEARIHSARDGVPNAKVYVVPLSLKTRFLPKQMIYQGRPDL